MTELVENAVLVFSDNYGRRGELQKKSAKVTKLVALEIAA